MPWLAAGMRPGAACAQHDIGDPLRCLHVASADGVGRLGVDQAAPGRDQRDSPPNTIVGGDVTTDEGARDVERGRLSDGKRRVHATRHLSSGTREVEGDAVVAQGHRALDDQWVVREAVALHDILERVRA